MKVSFTFTEASQKELNRLNKQYQKLSYMYDIVTRYNVLEGLKDLLKALKKERLNTSKEVEFYIVGVYNIYDSFNTPSKEVREAEINLFNDLHDNFYDLMIDFDTLIANTEAKIYTLEN